MPSNSPLNIVITGGAGFLGQRLLRALLRKNTLVGPGGESRTITRITLLDIAPPAQVPDDPRVIVEVGDISDRGLLERTIGTDTHSIFHLAAIVSGMAEAEFELGMRVNLDATRALLEVCRVTGLCQRVVFTSSVAVYGGVLPDTVLDTTAINPQSSYGAQKAVGELLVNDYSRKGFIDGRVLRLPTVSVRPGRPNAAASSFASGIIREPLNGEAANCPVDPDTRVWIISPAAAIDCLVLGHELPADTFGATRIVNLPGLSITAKEMVESLTRVAGEHVANRVTWTFDARISRIVASWPGAWDNARANAMGFAGDENFDDVIRQYAADAGRPLDPSR